MKHFSVFIFIICIFFHTANSQSNHTLECKQLSTISPEECSALELLYHKTGAENWFEKTGWFTRIHHCSWFGVTCDERSNVIGINLSANNLSGEIPGLLSNLKFRRYLTLSNNNLFGAIPAEIGSLQNLVQLDLYSNDLTGEWAWSVQDQNERG